MEIKKGKHYEYSWQHSENTRKRNQVYIFFCFKDKGEYGLKVLKRPTTWTNDTFKGEDLLFININVMQDWLKNINSSKDDGELSEINLETMELLYG